MGKSGKKKSKELTDDEVVEAVEDYIYNDDRAEKIFNKFSTKYSNVFKDIPKDLDEAMNGEQKLEYTEVFEAYQEEFEETMEAFLESKGVSAKKFGKILQKKIAESDSDNPNRATHCHWILLATSNYNAFIQVMHAAVHDKL